jgi:hypothetical protein
VATQASPMHKALDVALCYGWIDGPVRKGNETCWLNKFTPRGKRSVWSQVNKQHIERLTREGLIQPAGLAAVELAKADGRWPPLTPPVPRSWSLRISRGLSEIQASQQVLRDADARQSLRVLLSTSHRQKGRYPAEKDCGVHRHVGTGRNLSIEICGISTIPSALNLSATISNTWCPKPARTPNSAAMLKSTW